MFSLLGKKNKPGLIALSCLQFAVTVSEQEEGNCASFVSILSILITFLVALI